MNDVDDDHRGNHGASDDNDDDQDHNDHDDAEEGWTPTIKLPPKASGQIIGRLT